MRQERNHLKYNCDRLLEAKKAMALVNACSVPIDQAIKVALSSVGGMVFDALLKEVDQHVVWRVKLLTGGGRVKMYIDARSGHVLEAKAEITVDESYQSMPPEGARPNYLSPLKSVPRL
ncbi:MAG: PepSY domain-containing protein [Nitrospirae bacterium]|nr:PepSY domain-containing protein [Nitrospirota bacterium]